MTQKNTIRFNTEALRESIRMVGVDGCHELLSCLFAYLCDGIRPSGKTGKFMEAFERALQDAEALCTEE